MRVYEALAQAVVNEGVDVVFGLMGEGNMSVIYHLSTDHGVRYQPSRREDGAVAMANGYARVSGRVGVATVTHGPGLTNTISALTDATRARTPLVLIAGDTHQHESAGLQVIDQAAVIWPTGAYFQPLRGAATVYEDVELAFRIARTHRRTVVLNAPLDIQNAEFTGVASLPAVVTAAPLQPLEIDLRAAAEILRSAKTPVILAGRGAVAGDARAALEELAELTGAVLATTLLGSGFFQGNAFDLGLSGGYAHSLGQRILARADCVLAVGASLNKFTTDHGRAFPEATLIQCDNDPTAFGKWVRPDQAVLGDAGEIARGLCGLLQPLKAEQRTSFRETDDVAALSTFDVKKDFTDLSSDQGVDLRAFVAALEDLAPKNRSVVVGGGHYSSEACRMLSVPTPAQMVFTIAFGCIGLGLANMVGAAYGSPDLVLGIEGDGGTMMSLGELERVMSCNLPIAVVVLDDQCYGAEYHVLQASDRDPALSFFPYVDFAAVARAFGGDAVSIEAMAQVPDLGPRLAALTKPLLIHVKLDVRIRSEWYRDRAGVIAEDFVGTSVGVS